MSGNKDTMRCRRWGMGIKTVADTTAKERGLRQKIPLLGNGNNDSRNATTGEWG